MAKPTEDYTWAESANPGDVIEPALKRPSGYQFEDELPHQDFNWLFRTGGRWIHWLQKQFGPNKELTLDSSNGSLKVTQDTADLHVVQHDHYTTGNAILRTDVLTLNGAPRDATRRAQAPLDRSLYIQNAAKAVAEITWDGSPWALTGGYNVTGAVTDAGDGRSYEIALLDYSSITGIIMAKIDGASELIGGAAPRYYVRAEVDPGGVLRWLPRWNSGGTWTDWRFAVPSAPVETNARIVLIVY